MTIIFPNSYKKRQKRIYPGSGTITNAGADIPPRHLYNTVTNRSVARYQPTELTVPTKMGFIVSTSTIA